MLYYRVSQSRHIYIYIYTYIYIYKYRCLYPSSLYLSNYHILTLLIISSALLVCESVTWFNLTVKHVFFKRPFPLIVPNLEPPCIIIASICNISIKKLSIYGHLSGKIKTILRFSVEKKDRYHITIGSMFTLKSV